MNRWTLAYLAFISLSLVLNIVVVSMISGEVTPGTTAATIAHLEAWQVVFNIGATVSVAAILLRLTGKKE